MKNIYILVLAVGFTCAAAAQDQRQDSAMIQKIVTQCLVKGTAYGNLRQLCKTIGPRLTASKGMYAAENWGEALMKSMKADKVWRQECTVPHWVRGDKEVLRMAQVSQPAVKTFNVLSLGNSEGTGAKGIMAPVLQIDNHGELERLKDQVKGRIVFYNYRFRQDFVETFRAYGDAGTYRTSGPSRAARYGALAVVVRSVGSAPDNHPHTGATRYNDSFPKIPAVAIGNTDADRLEALLKKDGRNLFFLRNTCTMLPDTIAHNIIGEIRGSEFPDEIITIGGHLDSWDPAEGAHDDGAGIVQSMEVIQTFRAIGYQPKRTIRVVLFANEENGLRGGAKYADAAKANGEKHIMALESDAGGFSPRGFTGTMSAVQLEKFMAWKSLLEPYGIHKMGAGGGGADIGPLNRSFGTPVIGLSPDSQRYFDVHHAATDVFEAVNKRELHLGAGVMAAMVYLVDQYGL